MSLFIEADSAHPVGKTQVGSRCYQTFLLDGSRNIRLVEGNMRTLGINTYTFSVNTYICPKLPLYFLSSIIKSIHYLKWYKITCRVQTRELNVSTLTNVEQQSLKH